MSHSRHDTADRFHDRVHSMVRDIFQRGDNCEIVAIFRQLCARQIKSCTAVNCGRVTSRKRQMVACVRIGPGYQLPMYNVAWQSEILSAEVLFNAARHYRLREPYAKRPTRLVHGKFTAANFRESFNARGGGNGSGRLAIIEICAAQFRKKATHHGRGSATIIHILPPWPAGLAIHSVTQTD